ncbi:TPA: helix-turn-helix transcriptional regulator [Streptococcus pneumoniae]|nr:helix-turn-helix transcriptional regulator [Streptococcus pneumoniae]HEV6222394.1 helix-turn-helix transcriptional regulator [Streptococcus pneumoniae]HEV6375964.1 helix-turn-helix transcriptional regulator [Streptococcus pneumoniae]
MDNNDLLFRKPPNRLEKLMEDHGVTLKEVSENTGIPITTLSGYKKNQRAPKKNNAEILAEYFGVSVAYLMGIDDSCIDRSKKMTPFQSLVRDRGMSLKEISEATGIAYPTLSGYNQGIRTPKKKNAKILAEYFGVSIPYLLGYEENFTANKPNATISIELVKELYSIREKRSKLLQEYIELDKKERDVLEQIKEIVR